MPLTPEVSIPTRTRPTNTYKSVCRGCHGGCGALLHIEDGKFTKIEGNPDGPLNHGALCPIGQSAVDLVYHPKRLNYPMRRNGPRGGGQWERISWDEALDEVAERLNRIRATDGAHTIVMGTGTGRHHAAWVSRFGHALGTPNWCEPGFAQCFFPRLNTLKLTYGDILCNDVTGETGPACVMYWGHNPLVSGPDGETRFAARRALLAHKPKTIVVDPRRTHLAKSADIWLPLRPGTDDALALAFCHVIIQDGLYNADFVNRWTHGFDELSSHVQPFSPEWAEGITTVPAAKIREAARLFATTGPAMLEWGAALDHTPNSIQTCRAVALLPALTGNVDVPGGWILGMQIVGGFPDLLDAMPPEVHRMRLGYDQYKLLASEEAFYPAAHIPSVLHAMKTAEPYPVNAFMVFGNNTLATYANTRAVAEALANVPFIVHADLFLTPTANAFADIVLPAASWPELNEISTYPFFAENVLMPQQEVIRVGERKSDEEIFVELARRMGLEHCTESVEEVIEEMLRSSGHDISYQELCERGHFEIPLAYRKYEKSGFKTPTGKIELYSTRLEKMGYAPLPVYQEPPESPLSRPDLTEKYPLVLTTGARTGTFFCSEGRQIERLRRARKEPLAEMHPDTATRFGIKHGDWVWIENARGRIRQKASVVDGMQKDTVAIEFGWWYPEDKSSPVMGIYESGANMLTSNEPPYDPQMGTYQLRGLLCRIEKADSSPLEGI